jgi:formamidopyrimidine-DNA glycosylase
LPEYPEVVVYIERLRALAGGRRLERVRIDHPFLLRTAVPPVASVEGRRLVELHRLGKRIVFAFEPVEAGQSLVSEQLYLVLHLMISGRLHWYDHAVTVPKKRGLAAFDFESGTLLLTEASTQKRASLHIVQGHEALATFNRGGLEVIDARLEDFAIAVRSENHTLKRTLTDQTILSGIGNAYSDEILHRARLSPFLLSRSISDEQIVRLYEATRTVLEQFAGRLRAEAGDGLPTKVTAFRDDMAVHGRYGKPCPVCGTLVQRIRYAANETNYCPSCQTEGRLLADRALSRLLKADWPRTLEELEERRR